MIERLENLYNKDKASFILGVFVIVIIAMSFGYVLGIGAKPEPKIITSYTLTEEEQFKQEIRDNIRDVDIVITNITDTNCSEFLTFFTSTGYYKYRNGIDEGYYQIDIILDERSWKLEDREFTLILAINQEICHTLNPFYYNYSQFYVYIGFEENYAVIKDNEFSITKLSENGTEFLHICYQRYYLPK